MVIKTAINQFMVVEQLDDYIQTIQTNLQGLGNETMEAMNDQITSALKIALEPHCGGHRKKAKKHKIS